MELQTVDVVGRGILIPAYYRKLNSMPEDPNNSVSYGIETDHTSCFMILYPSTTFRSFPPDQKKVIIRTRIHLADNQGIIKIEANVKYAYSIIKTLRKPHGVLYTLTYQKFYPNFTVNIQAFFDEIGTTGIRDATIYELYRRNNTVYFENGQIYGWARDPYDTSITKGALMNLSEQEEFDSAFPDFPLSMCRDLVKVLMT